MDSQDLMELAKMLKLRHPKVATGNVVSSCPFAERRHLKADGSFGKDRKPSFGMKIVPEGESLYNCLSCGSRGNLMHLVFELGLQRGEDYTTAENFVIDNEIASAFERPDQERPKRPAAGQRRALGTGSEPPELNDLDVYPEDEYDRYRGKIPDYAQERGIPDDVCRAWDIGDDPRGGRMMLPVRRFDGKLVGLHGRTYRGERSKYLPYLPIRQGAYFYGEWMLRAPTSSTEEQRIVIVEGQLDAIRAHMAGFPVLALMGGICTSIQKRKLTMLERPLVILPDPNDTGRRWSRRLGDDLKNELSVFDAKTPENKDPGDMTVEEIRAAVASATLRL